MKRKRVVKKTAKSSRKRRVVRAKTLAELAAMTPEQQDRHYRAYYAYRKRDRHKKNPSRKKIAAKFTRSPRGISRPGQTLRYKITAQGTGKRMHYDGTNFSERPTVKTFATVNEAQALARSLVKRYPVLRKYAVRIESFP